MDNLVELSNYERFIYNLTLLGDENVICIAKLEDIDCVLKEEQVRKALWHLCKRHPLLRAHIDKNYDPKKLFFKIESELSEDKITFEWCQLGENKSLTDELEQFNNIFFNYDNKCLLWRVKCVNFKENGKLKHVIAFIVPLYITDGINITVICIELINILNSVLNGVECVEMTEKRDVILSLEQFVEKYNLFTEKEKHALEHSFKHDKNVNFNLPYRFKNLDDNGVKMCLLPLDKELSVKIVERSKATKTKLTGFLVSAAFYALKLLYEENNLYMQRDVSCFVPANLRIRFNPTVDFCDVRYLVVLTQINLLYPDFGKYENIWSEAEYVNKQLAKRTTFENGQLLHMTYNTEATTFINQLFEETANKNDVAAKMNVFVDCDLVISNVGTYPFSDRTVSSSPLKLEEIYHGDSLQSNPNGFAPMMLHVCTWDQRLMFQLSSNRKRFSSSSCERFMSLLQTVLKNSI